MNPPKPRAQVDANGMIRISADQQSRVQRQEDDVPVAIRKKNVDAPGARSDRWEHVQKNIAHATRTVAAEGERQLQWTVNDLQAQGRAWLSDTAASMKRMRNFLLQPVWIPRKKGPAKQRSRIRLFGEDVIRFGTTFAVMFGLLFFGLNYRSFSTIVAAQLDPLSSAQEAGKLSRLLEPSSPGAQVMRARAGDLLSMVPPVGPPVNRLVVPKLNLNVPIVIPTNTSLLNEDWKQLEDDIQNGLQHGVVHYPGTAKPGQAGNFFVTGHSSYYYGEFQSVFARLHELDIGDEYWVYYGGDKHRYRITEKYEVKPSDVSVLNQPTDVRSATLMTCTPVGTTLRRLIVRAEEIDVITGETLAVGEHGHETPLPKMGMELLPI